MIKITMKKSLFIVSVLVGLGMLFSTPVEARTTSVRGYYKPSTGTYVNPHNRTSPNRTKIDNYSTKGNYNPYTGKTGTKNYYGW